MILRGRRFHIEEFDTGWWWVAWRLFERVEGWAPSESDALSAVEHFLGKTPRVRSSA